MTAGSRLAALVDWTIAPASVLLHRRDRPSRGERENPLAGTITGYGAARRTAALHDRCRRWPRTGVRAVRACRQAQRYRGRGEGRGVTTGRRYPPDAARRQLIRPVCGPDDRSQLAGLASPHPAFSFFLQVADTETVVNATALTRDTDKKGEKKPKLEAGKPRPSSPDDRPRSARQSLAELDRAVGVAIDELVDHGVAAVVDVLDRRPAR